MYLDNADMLFGVSVDRRSSCPLCQDGWNSVCHCVRFIHIIDDVSQYYLFDFFFFFSVNPELFWFSIQQLQEVGGQRNLVKSGTENKKH